MNTASAASASALSPAIRTLRRLQQEIDERCKYLADRGRRSIEPDDPMVQMWLVVDVAAYHGATAHPGDLAELASLIRDIRTRGRAVGVRLLFPSGGRLLPGPPRRSPRRPRPGDGQEGQA